MLPDEEPKVVAEETQPDIDLEAAQAEISSELFGQGDEEGKDKVDAVEGEGKEPSGDADAVVAPPQQTEEEKAAAEAAKAAETSAEVQEIGAPKTWNKDELAKWATIPPEIQKELAPILARREQDFLNGITQYKEAAELGVKYNDVVAPYMPVLQAENVDPVQMFQSFAANHYLLSKGTPEQKIELAASLITGYEIPLAELLNYMADNVSEPVSPQITALEGQVKELRNLISSAQTTNSDRATSQVVAEIEAFAADPAHPYFDELADDISKIFKSGMAETLAEAYDKAVFANPKTRQKEVERLTAEARTSADAEAQARKDKRAKSTAADVKVTPKSRDGTVPVGSIDDTLEETMAAIQSRA